MTKLETDVWCTNMNHTHPNYIEIMCFLFMKTQIKQQIESLTS